MSQERILYSERLRLESAANCGKNKAYFFIYPRGSQEKIGKITLELKTSAQGLTGTLCVNTASQYAGSGYGIEAMKRVSEYAYEDLGLVKLRAKAESRNLAAEYSLRRVGFRPLAQFTQDGAFQFFENTSPYFAISEI